MIDAGSEKIEEVMAERIRHSFSRNSKIYEEKTSVSNYKQKERANRDKNLLHQSNNRINEKIIRRKIRIQFNKSLIGYKQKCIQNSLWEIGLNLVEDISYRISYNFIGLKSRVIKTLTKVFLVPIWIMLYLTFVCLLGIVCRIIIYTRSI